jgi:phosphonatase-like hydrolase
MIKMIVFDMAGTAIDENNVVYKTLRTAINEAGFDFTLEQVLAEGAGKEKLQAIKDIAKRDGAFADKIYQNFIVLLAKAYDTLDITAQPGAEELFRTLKQRGIYVILNTGYDIKTAESIMKKVGWMEGNQVDGLVTASHVQNNRPKPDMIHYAMERFGLKDAGEVAKVGDSIIDIEEGQSAGCGLNVGITTGAQTRAQMLSAKPDYVIDHLLEILPLLNREQSVIGKQ